MRTSFRLAAVTLVCAAALSASGCAPDTPVPKPTASRSDAPLFATDEEALAAAEKAYAAYLDMVDKVLQRGGTTSDELKDVAQSDALIQAKNDAEEFSKNGYHTMGSTILHSIQLQEYSQDSGQGSIRVIAYVCEDASAVDLIDSAGTSIVQPGRVALTPFEVEFRATGDLNLLSVASRALWGESSPCE